MVELDLDTFSPSYRHPPVIGCRLLSGKGHDLGQGSSQKFTEGLTAVSMPHWKEPIRKMYMAQHEVHTNQWNQLWWGIIVWFGLSFLISTFLWSSSLCPSLPHFHQPFIHFFFYFTTFLKYDWMYNELYIFRSTIWWIWPWKPLWKHHKDQVNEHFYHLQLFFIFFWIHSSLHDLSPPIPLNYFIK